MREIKKYADIAGGIEVVRSLLQIQTLHHDQHWHPLKRSQMVLVSGSGSRSKLNTLTPQNRPGDVIAVSECFLIQATDGQAALHKGHKGEDHSNRLQQRLQRYPRQTLKLIWSLACRKYGELKRQLESVFGGADLPSFFYLSCSNFFCGNLWRAITPNTGYPTFGVPPCVHAQHAQQFR